jgi:hypothetical protein
MNDQSKTSMEPSSKSEINVKDVIGSDLTATSKDHAGVEGVPAEFITADEAALIGKQVEGTMNGKDWIAGELFEVIDLFVPYGLLVNGEKKWCAEIRPAQSGREAPATESWPNEQNAVDGRDVLIEKLYAALEEARRAIGGHIAPEHCYSTGPLTGNSYRDLVECPACSFISVYDALLSTRSKP